MKVREQVKAHQTFSSNMGKKILGIRMFESEWEELDGEVVKQGGQGTIVKVRNKLDGNIVGGLKRLHPQHLQNTERRFRMQQEANSLLALNGLGVPKLLFTNAQYWNTKSVSIFLIMEWISGCSLNEFISKRPADLGSSLSAIGSILRTIDASQKLNVYHRDLKPDNIILRECNIGEPVLVDFGMSWSKPDPDKSREFETPNAQEVGNRFLRLPEHAPGKDSHDPRSDITMAVGLLFYMLSGVYPRVLKDAHDQMPHEAHMGQFSTELVSDPRWPRLQRVFFRAFQPMLDMRFQTIAELQSKLSDLDPPQDGDEDAILNAEAASIEDLLNSAAAKKIMLAESILRAGSEAFMQSFNAAYGGKGFAAGGNGPNLIQGGKGTQLAFFIVRNNSSEPMARFEHTIILTNGNSLSAAVSIEGKNLGEYYSGALADVDGLTEAVKKKAKWIVAQLFGIMKVKLSQHFN